MQLQHAHAQLQTVQKEINWALETQDISHKLCYLKSFEHDEMVLCATTTAAAFRIRQILPTLQSLLNQKGIKVITIKIVNQ